MSQAIAALSWIYAELDVPMAPFVGVTPALQPLSVFVDAAHLLVDPTSLLFICIGVMFGILAGAIPGFSASNAIAVALPFSLVLTPEGAIMFLAGIYVGANYGGCLPAILVNAPGTPGAAATTLDGYPMSQQGEAQRAIGISIFGSAISGFLGALLILFLIQPIGTIALGFGNVEIFVLGLFGLATLAIVLGDDIKKGLVSGFFGLLFAAITADAATGQTRMTFGSPHLHDQVPFIPIIIGLFAISEMFYLVKREKISTERVEITYREVFAGGRWVIARPRQLVRAMGVGVSIGAIPGAGPAISNFISWSLAKSRSLTPETFGKGNPEGVLASEACDNATVAGTLVPTLTLGIPGSGSTAVMLGALLLHGIFPGPRLMTHFMTETVAIMMGVVLANVILLVFALAISKYILRVVLLPANILVPAIIVATAFGSFALRNAVFDVWFMVIFGVLGFMMREKGYPIVPMVLGVILGPIVEPAFQRSMLLGRDDPMIFFSSRIAITLWILMVIVFVLPYALKKLDIDLGI